MQNCPKSWQPLATAWQPWQKLTKPKVCRPLEFSRKTRRGVNKTGSRRHLSPLTSLSTVPPSATPLALHPVAKFNARNSQYEKFIKKAKSKSLSEMENQIELPKNLRREASQRCEVYKGLGCGVWVRGWRRGC